jgi:hypothetical protein
MWGSTPSSHDRYMNHPLMLLGPAGFFTLSRRAAWALLIVTFAVAALCGFLDGGESEPTHRPPAPELAVTIVSATTVPPSGCGTLGTGCRS